MTMHNILEITIGPSPASESWEAALVAIRSKYLRRLLTPQMRFALETELAHWADHHGVPMPPLHWYGPDRDSLFVGELDAAAFETITGRPPVQDDLERVNCHSAGTIGHDLCGWCNDHGTPRFECGCVVPR